MGCSLRADRIITDDLVLIEDVAASARSET